MKQILVISLIALTGLFLSQCTADKKNSLQDIITAHFEAMNRHDTIAISKFYSDSATLESPNWEGTKKGPAEAREVYSRYFISSPDLKYTISHILSTENEIVVEYESHGTMMHLEDGGPAYMLGKTYTLKNSTRFEIKDGKIMKSVSYFDQVAFLRQVGFFEQK